MCGLNDLSREERLLKANEILKSNDLKQAICHQIQGCTFKDIERSMEAVIKERQRTQYEEEQLEEQEFAPEKYDLELDFKINKHASDVRTGDSYGHLTREDVARLLAASRSEPKPYEPEVPPAVYPPLDRDVAQRLVREHYEYIEEQKRKKKEQEVVWDFTKTIASDIKTDTKTKPGKPTKASKR